MSTRRMLVQHLGIAVVASLVLVAGFSSAGTRPRPLWFVAMALAIAFGSLAVRLLAPELIETTWPQRHEEALGTERARSNDSRAQFLATWVQESQRDPHTFGHRVRPLLLELTSDRLRHRHGVDPGAEPDRAKALTGDQLWELITDPAVRTATYDEIEQAVQTIEKL